MVRFLAVVIRAHVLVSIADYERAAELAERLVHDAPDDATTWLARARTHATFHRFTEALADSRPQGEAVWATPRWTRSGRRSSRRSGATGTPWCCARKRPNAGLASPRWVRWPCSRPNAARSSRPRDR